MNREFFVKLFGIPKECQRDGSYKSLGRFFKTEIITRKNLDAMYQHLDKTYRGDVRCSSRYGVMKAFLGYEMTRENMTYISGRAGLWGDDPTSRHEENDENHPYRYPIKYVWTNDVMRAVLYPTMTKNEVWEHLFREAHDIRTKEIEEENALDEEGLNFTELGGRPVESINKSKRELRVLKAFENAGFEIK